LIALPDIRQTIQDSNLIIFNIPHQFLKGICKRLKGIDFTKVRGISCLKGLEVNKDGVLLLCHYIKQELGIHCGVLSGANLAPEVARGNYSETTIAYDKPDDFYVGDVDEDMLKLLFQTHYFHVRVCKDIAAVSLSGALKNIVALASGFVEGKGWGDNARAAIMRRGLLEMIKFGSIFFPNCSYQTFTEESAGVADLITSCLGGRNRKIGMEMARTGKSAQELEKELLNGQSAQGIITCKEVHELLSARGMVDDFPLFTATYRIAYENMSIDDLPSFLKD
jgi:glycerol-3-phosphate dehydrogenase (NAD+)